MKLKGIILNARQQCVQNGKCFIDVQFKGFVTTIRVENGSIDKYERGDETEVIFEDDPYATFPSNNDTVLD
jgi:hypothetical protein